MAGGGQFNNPYQQPGGAYGQAIGQGQMRPNMRGMNPNQRALQRQIGTMGPGAGMAPQPAFGQANMYSTLPMPQQPLGTAQPTQADLYAQQMMGNSGGAGYNMPQLTQQQIMERLQQQMPQQVPQADPRMEYMKQLYAGQQQTPAFQIASGRGTTQPTQADLYAQQMMGNSGGAGYNMPQLTQQQMAERMQQQMPLTGGGMMPPPRQIGAAGQIAGLAPALGIAGLPRM